MEVSILIVAAIVVAIALGYILNVNVGFFAMAFGYIIGVFILDLRVRDVINMWPANMFFVLMAISFFYGFAISNGTLQKVSDSTIYLFRKSPALLPIVLYSLTVVLCAMGPGQYAVFAFMAAPIMYVSAQIGMSRLLGAIIVVSGGVAGFVSPFAPGGGITKGLIENAGYMENAGALTTIVFRNTFLAETIVFILAYIILKGYKVQALNMEKPEPFDRNQKVTCLLVCLSLASVMLPPLLQNFMPHVKLFAVMKAKTDPIFASLLAAVLALILRVGNEKEAMAKIPWNVIILVCGVGVLISVAIKAGTIKSLGVWMGTYMDATMAPIVLGLVAGFMSFFSSTMGVVMPTLFPIVPSVAGAANAEPGVLFSLITVCAAFTGFSPFSTAGALCLGGLTDEKEIRKLYTQLLILPVCAMALAILLVVIGFF